MRREFRSLAAPETVRDALASLPVAADAETVPIADAHDRILASRVDAPIDVPGFDRAAMDGYAIQSTETVGADEADPAVLDIAGSVHAGERPSVAVEAGTAVEVATGAVLPDGADAVVPVERTRERDDAVAITTTVAPGDHVMPRGADLAAGEYALSAGTRLGPRHVGLLAALGHETVPVRGRPAVAVVSTGEELRQPGQSLDSDAGQIYDVNSHAIASAVRAAGGEPTIYESVSDEYDTLRETLERAAEESTLVLTSGSTSAGSTDLLYELVEDHGEKLVHGVALKPGRPMLVGRLFETPYVGLPGYPVSAMMVFRVFVAPLLRDAAGRPTPETATVEATLRSRVRYDGGRLRLVPVGLVGDGSGDLVAYAPAKGSGATTTLVETDGVVRMPAAQSLLARESRVEVDLFDATDPIPGLLGVGEPDPTLFELLDAIPTARYLTLSPADARRWLDDGIPDVILTPERAGDGAGDGKSDAPAAGKTTVLARWEREWGLVVPPENPNGIETLADLAGDVRLANLDTNLALRDAFGEALAAHDVDTADLDGFHRELPGIESAARSVAAGRADAGLGLARTAADLDLGFVPGGTQKLTLTLAESRQNKRAVSRLETAVSERADEFDILLP